MRRSGLTPLQAAALVCIYSFAAYLPIYALSGLSRLRLVPVAATLLGIPILDEWPTPLATVAVAAIIAGVLLAARTPAVRREPGL